MSLPNVSSEAPVIWSSASVTAPMTSASSSYSQHWKLAGDM
jgi:hypothetical protein